MSERTWHRQAGCPADSRVRKWAEPSRARIAVCLLLIAAFVALSGCGETRLTSVTIDPTIEPGSNPVSVSRALGLFDAVCGAGLPKFAKSKQLAASNGIGNQASTGTIFSETDNLSIKILDGPGLGKTCSMVFASAEPRSKAFAAYSRKFGKISTPKTAGAPEGILLAGYSFQARFAVVQIKEPKRRNGLNYYNLRLWSER